MLKTNGNDCTTEVELPDALEAPVEKGDAVGMLIVRNADGEVIAETTLTAAEGAPKAGFLDCFAFVLRVFTRSECRAGGVA